MRIRYTIPFKRKIIIDDHWSIPIQGGRLRIVEEGRYATAIELTFEKQPLDYAPRIEHHAEGEIAMTMTVQDRRLIAMRRQIDDAVTFLECFYEIDLATDDIESEYEAESLEEETKIPIKKIRTHQHDFALNLPFDMLTRALMAAEENNAPKFETALVSAARKALERREFINSFRYSFLLIESIYGEGQFRKNGLKAALKRNVEFRNIVEFAASDKITRITDLSSHTGRLLATKPTCDDIIDHIVEQRGFYFHGNNKRTNAWKPDQQDEAEPLALLTIGIAMQISMKAANSVFKPEFERRHFEDAINTGASIVYQIKFKYRDPEEEFSRERRILITTPGTKPTHRSAHATALHFLETFRNNQPVSALISAECTIQGTETPVFNLTFHTSPDVSD